MIIDEDILKDGIDEVLLAKLIGKHSLEQERYEKLYNYYIGKHAICERRRSSDNIANNKIVCNHAKYIVDIAKSYLVGNPVAYSCSDGYDIEAVKNCFAVQDMPSLDAEFEKTMSIFGKLMNWFMRTSNHSRKCMLAAEQHVYCVRCGRWRNCTFTAYIITKSVTLTARLQVFAVLCVTGR